MKLLTKSGMVKRLAKADRELEAVHLAVRRVCPTLRADKTVDEFLARLIDIRVGISIALSWLDR